MKVKGYVSLHLSHVARHPRVCYLHVSSFLDRLPASGINPGEIDTTSPSSHKVPDIFRFLLFLLGKPELSENDLAIVWQRLDTRSVSLISRKGVKRECTVGCRVKI